MEDVRQNFERQRRTDRMVIFVLLVILVAAFGDHIYRVISRPQVRHALIAPTTTTTAPVKPIQSFTNYEASQYGRQCGNFSPSVIDLQFWYGTEYSCAPSWLKGINTFYEMEDQWYGHACGDYSPTQHQIVAFNNAAFHCPGHVTKYLPPFEK